MKKTLKLIALSILLVSFTFKNPVLNNKFFVKSVKFKDSDLKILTIKKNSMNFSVSTENHQNFDFYMNSNFFTKSGDPIGEVIINGKKINNRVKYGGFFYVINGVPGISSGSRPKNVQYSCQTKYIGIINGKINKRITNSGINKDKAYRTLIGKNKQGDLIIIHSDRFGMISMTDICEIGVQKGITLGLIFDGGSSVDIGITDKNQSHSFKSVPSFAKALANIDEPPVYITGKFN